MVEMAQIEGWRRALSAADFDAPAVASDQPDGALTDADRVAMLRALETLKCAAEAVQAELTADLDTSQRAMHAARGIPSQRQGRGVAAQVGLARRESPHHAREHLGLAQVLRGELPHTRAAFRAGRISEWRATLIARETTGLTLADRRTIDARLAGDPGRVERMSNRELAAAARALAWELDPAAVRARHAKAQADRHVTLRPAPDGMARLSALLTAVDGVSVFASLSKAADTLTAAGDGRTRHQLMSDTLVDRVTGRTLVSQPTPADDPDDNARAEDAPAPSGTPTPVMINVVLSDDVLLGDSDEPAHLDGYGPIPADLARDLAAANTHPDHAYAVQLRRLFSRPATGELVAMESRARYFDDALADFVVLRDRFCRTPWCDAPIRHLDHVQQACDGGPTSAHNAQGNCEACNYATEAPGWRAGPAPDDPSGRHTVETVTPTGHRHTSTAPPTRQRPESPGQVPTLEPDPRVTFYFPSFDLEYALDVA